MHRKVCNHPLLVKAEIDSNLKVDPGYLSSGKLIGLVELLTESEIIVSSTDAEENKNEILV
jgi:hypothetical protein